MHPLLLLALSLLLGCESTPKPDDTTDSGDSADTVDSGDTAGACVAAGGTVVTLSCCPATGDFPNGCVDGPCGCDPTSSHDVLACDCPDGTCWDGTGCVAG